MAGPPHPIRTGALLAVLAALLFGVTTPLIQRFGAEVGPFTTAALLYAGAAIASAFAARRGREAPVRRGDVPRLVAIAVAGAVVAPACLAWGLQRSSGAAASLLLNLEAVFTVLLARWLYREPIGRRVAFALVAMVSAGAVLAASGAVAAEGLGVLAVALATAAWALDNTWTRPLADRSPAHVVRWKASLGAALSFAASFALGERLPSAAAALALGLCGATGYGMSLRLYLLAQRRIGAGRTASIFALAPFVGAAGALLLFDRGEPWTTLVAAALFAVGVALHVTEGHGHVHTHEAVTHEHAHRHDDGHHDHTHDPPVTASHSHEHRHDETTHGHAHAPDVHHQHRHP